MKLLNYNAAVHLFERMKSLENGPHDSWKAIRIGLAGKGEYTSALRMHFFVAPLRKMLTNMDGYIYVVDNGDIFILFQGRMDPVMKMLTARFTDIADVAENDLFTVYDLSRYWQLFYDLCERQAQTAIHARLQQMRPTPQIMFRNSQEMPT